MSLDSKYQSPDESPVELSDDEETFYHQVNWLYLKTLELDFCNFPYHLERDIRGQEFPHALDVGTGYGAMLYRLKEILQIRYHEMVGVDINSKLVNYGQPYLEAKGYNDIHLHVSSVYDLRDEYGMKYPDKYFHLVTGLDFLEHVDPERALAEINRVTADNGIVYFPQNVGDKNLPSRKKIYLDRFIQDLKSLKIGKYQYLEPNIMDKFLSQNKSADDFINNFFSSSLQAFTILYPWHPLDDLILRNFEHYLIGHQYYKGKRYGDPFIGGILDTVLQNSGFDILSYHRTDRYIDRIHNDRQRSMMFFLVAVFTSANYHKDLILEEPNKKIDDAQLLQWQELRNQQIKHGSLGFQVIERTIVGRKKKR